MIRKKKRIEENNILETGEEKIIGEPILSRAHDRAKRSFSTRNEAEISSRAVARLTSGAEGGLIITRKEESRICSARTYQNAVSQEATTETGGRLLRLFGKILGNISVASCYPVSPIPDTAFTRLFSVR